MKKKRLLKVFLAVLALAAVGAGVYALLSRPAQLSLEPETMTLKLGETGQLTAATDSHDTLIWYAENESVAYVDPNGCVTALGLGETRLVCYVHHAYAFCNLTVTDGRVRGDAGAGDADADAAAQAAVFDSPAEKQLDTSGAVLTGTDAAGQTIVFNGDGTYAVSGYFYYMDVVKFVYDVADTYTVENGVLKLNNTGRLHCDGPQGFSYDIGTFSTVNVSDGVMTVKIIGDGPDGPVHAATFTFSAEDAAKLGADPNREVHADDPVIPNQADSPENTSAPEAPAVPDTPEGVTTAADITNGEGQRLTVYSDGSYTVVGTVMVEAHGFTLPFDYVIRDSYTVQNGVFTPSSTGTVNVNSTAIGAFTMTPEFTVSGGADSAAVNFVAEADSGVFTLATFVLSAEQNAAIAERFHPNGTPGETPAAPDTPVNPDVPGSSSTTNPIQFFIDIGTWFFEQFQAFLEGLGIHIPFPFISNGG